MQNPCLRHFASIACLGERGAAWNHADARTHAVQVTPWTVAWRRMQNPSLKHFASMACVEKDEEPLCEAFCFIGLYWRMGELHGSMEVGNKIQSPLSYKKT